MFTYSEYFLPRLFDYLNLCLDDIGSPSIVSAIFYLMGNFLSKKRGMTKILTQISRT